MKEYLLMKWEGFVLCLMKKENGSDRYGIYNRIKVNEWKERIKGKEQNTKKRGLRYKFKGQKIN